MDATPGQSSGVSEDHTPNHCSAPHASNRSSSVNMPTNLTSRLRSDQGSTDQPTDPGLALTNGAWPVPAPQAGMRGAGSGMRIVVRVVAEMSLPVVAWAAARQEVRMPSTIWSGAINFGLVASPNYRLVPAE